MIIGIIGNGFVGKATFQLKCKDIDILAYDIDPEACVPKGLTLDKMNECELIFISVPTPMSKNGSCHLNIIHSVLEDLKKINYNGQVILRSTVPVGTSDSLNVSFMPEFLTEKNFINDFINNKDWIFGLKGNNKDIDFKKKISKLFNLAYENKKINFCNLNFVSNTEAEMIKLFRNCYLATKVSFCNEIFQFCKIKNINYENVRKLSCNDERIQHSHSHVPGPDGKLGFGGTCFPKDLNSLIKQIQDVKGYCPLLNTVKKRNEEVDRTERDWTLNKGRSII